MLTLQNIADKKQVISTNSSTKYNYNLTFNNKKVEIHGHINLIIKMLNISAEDEKFNYEDSLNIVVASKPLLINVTSLVNIKSTDEVNFKVIKNLLKKEVSLNNRYNTKSFVIIAGEYFIVNNQFSYKNIIKLSTKIADIINKKVEDEINYMEVELIVEDKVETEVKIEVKSEVESEVKKEVKKEVKNVDKKAGKNKNKSKK